MNTKRNRFVCGIIFIFSLISLSTGIPAVAATSYAPIPKFSPPVLPPVITLFEQTRLYSEPDDSVEPIAALSPQDVGTIEAEQDWYAKQSGEKVWIKIKTTWAGDLWMHLDYEKIGIVKPVDTNITLLWPASLYTQPVSSAITDAVLAPQTVHANALFERPGLGATTYRIETSWLGDMWIVSNMHILTGMEILNREMDLPTETLYMEDYDTEFRLLRPSDAKMIPPQKVFAMEKTTDGHDIYHVRAQDGTTFWINLNFAQPANAERVNESIKLSKDTYLHLFPTAPYPIFGAITPQAVNAFEKWSDPQGKRWYHIHTWEGDMWIQPET